MTARHARLSLAHWLVVLLLLFVTAAAGVTRTVQPAEAAPAAPQAQTFLPTTHDPGSCTHGCYATEPICVIQATTWGPLQTMWARWWYASYSVVGDFRSPQTGCADYPMSRTFVFSAFDDPSYNNCWKWENISSRAADGHWNTRITVYMNWGIASCRTNQVEIEHRTGAAIGWVLGVPIWASNNSPWTYCINNMTEWSIANINQLTTWCGQQLWPIYGQNI